MILSPQAMTVIVIMSITALLSSAVMFKYGVGFMYILSSLLTWAVFILLLTFDTNCLTKGPCEVWSWIRTTLYIIMPVITILLLINTLASEGRIRDISESTEEEEYRNYPRGA